MATCRYSCIVMETCYNSRVVTVIVATHALFDGRQEPARLSWDWRPPSEWFGHDEGLQEVEQIQTGACNCCHSCSVCVNCQKVWYVFREVSLSAQAGSNNTVMFSAVVPCWLISECLTVNLIFEHCSLGSLEKTLKLLVSERSLFSSVWCCVSLCDDIFHWLLALLKLTSLLRLYFPNRCSTEEAQALSLGNMVATETKAKTWSGESRVTETAWRRIPTCQGCFTVLDAH